MNRYIMFSGFDYESSGGFDDMSCSGESIEDCLEKTEGSRYDWVHFLDTVTMERVDLVMLQGERVEQREKLL